MKYLFTAVYADGTVLTQTDEDISTRDPLRSAFFDVDHDNLIGFGIESEKDAITVDIRDGSFSINGTHFDAYDGEVLNRRLVYFRRNVIDFDQSSKKELGRTTTFFIGWQGNDPATGQNVQRVLSFT